jgi:hypothetical protein
MDFHPLMKGRGLARIAKPVIVAKPTAENFGGVAIAQIRLRKRCGLVLIFRIESMFLYAKYSIYSCHSLPLITRFRTYEL